MRLGEPANKNTKRNILLIRWGLVLVFVIAFWREIWGVLKILWTTFAVLLLRFPFMGIDQADLNSFGIILFNGFFGFAAVALLWMVLISAQALLPVNNLLEVYRTTWRLWLYIIHRHGQAVFIRDGKVIATKEDWERKGYGVIVVDFNSAVVLETRDAPPGLSQIMGHLDMRLLHAIGLTDVPVASRVCGPGIVFTNPNERIRGAVDLRKQFRVQRSVSAYTREGIELTANVNAIFTVGMDPEPDALQVTFLGEPRPENVRVCVFKPVQKRGLKYLRLAELSDELDPADKREICATALAIQSSAEWGEFKPLPTHPLTPVFNKNRAFSAVYAQATNNEKAVLDWTELPTRVAAEFYREILPTINYDELYDIRGGGKLPLPDFKAKLKLAMRNNGVLAYRLIYHANGDQLLAEHDYPEKDLKVSQIRQLTNSKLLRDRGIKIIASGFGDPSPVSVLVYQQRLDSWRAKWEQELDITRAGRDLQAMRIRSRALANAQYELWCSLSQIFSLHEYPDEALAVRVMQALETASADPKTRALLPGNVLDVMRQVSTLLIPPQLPGDVPIRPGGGGTD